MMPDPLTICEAGKAIRAGRLTPLELVERCLEQIRGHDERLRAWVVIDADGSRKAARKASAELAAGRDPGPLAGIPIGIKDIVDVEGFPTKAGSPLRENHVAQADAPLVAALRRAGGIILGKTVTVEFACFDPSPSRNPWDPELGHSPGGSSSGSAVAVAAGMCLGAIGTQTGGSLVRPASYCGIATCKPTFGRVDSDGIVPVSHHLDHPGPMARRVADLQILLEALPSPGRLSQFSRRGLSQFSRSENGTVPFEPEAAKPSPPPRLGLVAHFFMERADPSIRKATQAAIDQLRRAGARIETVPLTEDFDEVLTMHGTIMAAEAAAYHRRQFAAHREAYGPKIAGLLDEGMKLSAVDYAAALAHQRAFRRRVASLFAGFDALVMPATDTTAPPTLDTTGCKTFQAPWSYAGVPVVSIPCGLAADQMPAAIQLVRPHHEDAALLSVAQWCETALDFRALPLLAS
jgi:aspartyl-tRNA(Asn)/glutamyl-tRNA(Gln) amidotransferase subunit A